MRAVRGRAATAEEDREVTRALRDDVRDSGERVVRAWTPHRQVAFGRRDARADGYEAAREAAEAHGFPPYQRAVGGRAVAYTGTTIAFVRIEPLDDIRSGLDARYDAATADLRSALTTLGVDAKRGEPPNTFCPGDHSLSADGKIVGLAQRLSNGVAQTAGVLVVRDHEEIAAVLDPVYEALDVPFDPASVGSLARAGGESDPVTVARAVEAALAGDCATTVEHVG